jgi:hypothetical protein
MIWACTNCPKDLTLQVSPAAWNCVAAMEGIQGMPHPYHEAVLCRCPSIALVPIPPAGLRSLVLTSNYYSELPPALTAATSLSRLSLAACEELAVAPAELRVLLACLPGLKVLVLPEHLEPTLSGVCSAHEGLKMWCA